MGAASATNAQGGAGSTATKSGVLAHATGTSDGVFLSRRVGACTAATYRRERDSVDTNGLGRPRSAREGEGQAHTHIKRLSTLKMLDCTSSLPLTTSVLLRRSHRRSVVALADKAAKEQQLVGIRL